MPEWAIYVLVALMWVIGTGLVIAFVLIMYFVFGKQLKKLGFHVSVKDGIGVDVELHEPIESTAKHPAISQQTPLPPKSNLQVQVSPKSQATKSTNKPIENQPIDNYSSDTRDRIKQIIGLLHTQRLPGTLFGMDTYETLQFYPLGKVSFLPKSLASQFDIHAIISLEITKDLSFMYKDSAFADHYNYNELFVVCVQEAPKNQNKWVSDLRSRANILGKNSLMWVVSFIDFFENKKGENSRYALMAGFSEPKILTSSLIDIETLEIKLGKHQAY